MIILAGAARQLKDFFDALDLHLSGKLSPDEMKAFDAFCAKATTDEHISEGLRLARLVGTRSCRHRDDGRGRCIDCGAFIET